MTKQQANAKLIGQLHRVDKTVSIKKHKIIATLEFMLIAKKNGYKPKTISQCALRVFTKTNNKIWYEISQLIQRIHTFWT